MRIVKNVIPDSLEGMKNRKQKKHKKITKWKTKVYDVVQ